MAGAAGADDANRNRAAHVAGGWRVVPDRAVLRAGPGPVAELAPEVGAPGPYLPARPDTAAPDGQAVHVARRYGGDVGQLTGPSRADDGDWPVLLQTIDSVAELTVIAISPGSYSPVGEQGQAVRGAPGHREYRGQRTGPWPRTVTGLADRQFSPVVRLQVVPIPSWPSELEPQLMAVPVGCESPFAADAAGAAASSVPTAAVARASAA